MASVLIIDDEAALTSALATFFGRTGGHTVSVAHTGADGLELFQRTRPDLVLLDIRLPDMTGYEILDRLRHEPTAVVMMTGFGEVALAVQAMQQGAENFLTKPIDLAHLGAVAERAFDKARLRQMNRYLTSRLGQGPDGGEGRQTFLGSSAPMVELAAQIQVLAASDRTTVLIVGESGSGKGRIAELIHSRSPRADRPLVEVNCAALTAESLDTELFGVEHGAPGARGDNGAPEVRTGLFELADGGSVFLDEVGDLAPVLQPKLLGVLEGKTFRRVGGTREVSANVRLIAATSKDLVNEVTAGTFREDLYYRLNVMPVYLPPLRARSREDLIELIAHVLGDLHPALSEAPTEVSDDALEAMLRYAWPGNVRELRNVLERAMIVARGQSQIVPAHLPSEVRDAVEAVENPHVPRSLDEIERAHIERTLRAHAGNRTHAARELRISRATLIKKIKQYGHYGT
jgi:two-component system response regulator AtoC